MPSAAEKPVAKKPVATKSAADVYLLFKSDDKTALFVPQKNAINEARAQEAVVYGPYHSLEQGILALDTEEFDLDDYSVSNPLIVYVKQGDSFKEVKLIGSRSIVVL